MKRWFTVVALVAAVLFAAAPALAAENAAKGKAAGPSGEKLFQQHCVACHAKGGNIINPKKTLHAKDLKANKITTPEDIVEVMRNPGPGMPVFDEKTIPDAQAKAIGQYILTTFK